MEILKIAWYQMDLRTFIKEALVDIVGGVTDAQSAINRGKIVPRVKNSYKTIETGISDIQTVDFSVAVTTESRKGSEAKLSVVAVVVGGAVRGESGSGSEHVASLKFKVPVKLPRHQD